MPIVKLTQQFINNDLHCEAGKTRIEYCDSELPGLYVEVRKAVRGRGLTIYDIKMAKVKPVIKKSARRMT